MLKNIKFECNLINILFFYIFGVLYLQIVEMILHIKITEVVLIVSLLLILNGILQRKIKFGFDFIFVCLVVGIYLFLYFFQQRDVFSYVYPLAFLALLLPLLMNNASLKPSKSLQNAIAVLSCIYLALNLLFYMFRLENCFQLADKLQFKGVLPHSNMFCGIVLCVYAFNFQGKDILSVLNRVLCIFLIYCTYSRTYIAAIILLLLIKVVTSYGKCFTLGARIFIFGFIAVSIGPFIIMLMLKYIPAMERFVKFGFTGNGRQHLSEAYYFVIANSSFIDKLFGIGMTSNYVVFDITEFSHSFTENSYIGMFLLFGFVGVTYFGLYLIKILFKFRGIQSYAILAVFLMTLYVQDTLLSVQAGISLFTAVYYINLQSKIMRSNKKMFKRAEYNKIALAKR